MSTRAAADTTNCTTAHVAQFLPSATLPSFNQISDESTGKYDACHETQAITTLQNYAPFMRKRQERFYSDY